MALIAATRLAPVNNSCAGEVRSPTVASAAWNCASVSGGSKNWLARDQAAVVAADALHLPQQHQVLDGVPHQRGEGELAQDKQRRHQRGHEWVQPLDHLGEEPQSNQGAGHRTHVDAAPPNLLPDDGAAGRLEHEVLGRQSVEESLLACLLVHGSLLC